MNTGVKTVSIVEVYGLRKTHLSNRNKRPFSKTIQAIASKFLSDLDHTSMTSFIVLS